MEFIDPTPEPEWPYTIFDATDGSVIEHACCYKAALAYEEDPHFKGKVVILRTERALFPSHVAEYHR